MQCYCSMPLILRRILFCFVFWIFLLPSLPLWIWISLFSYCLLLLLLLSEPNPGCPFPNLLYSVHSVSFVLESSLKLVTKSYYLSNFPPDFIFSLAVIIIVFFLEWHKKIGFLSFHYQFRPLNCNTGSQHLHWEFVSYLFGLKTTQYF